MFFSHLDLDSVIMVMPMGSSVPPTLYEDLQKNMKKLMFVYNVYGMTEISGALTNSMDVKCLGYVAEGATVKILDPDSGNICGPNEVFL